MKYLKLFVGGNILGVILLLSSGTNLVSCTKQIVHDTTTLHDTTNIHDTTTVTDTLIITDTVCKVCNVERGLVAYFNFKDGSLLDGSGKNNNIIFNNAVKVPDRFGSPDDAYQFDGSSTYMRIANSPSINPDSGITLMAIVNINGFYNGTCHGNDIISKGYPDQSKGFYALRFQDVYHSCYDAIDYDHQYFVGTYGDNLTQGNNTGATSDTGVINKGKWYNIIYTYNGKESKLYVNGELQGVQEKDVVFTPNSNDLFIGRHEDPAFPYWFNGVLDELRIYNRALCGSEVKQLNCLRD